MDDNVSPVTLVELLDQDLNDNATTASGLTNHLPMALVAKAGLGAPSKELRRFSEKYRARLVPTGDVVEHLTPTTWRRAVGEPRAYADLVEYFNREITEHDVDTTLRAHLSVLVDGISGAAFHGAIRLAYALDVRSQQRVASALAYLASSATTLGPLDEGALVSDDPMAALSPVIAACSRESLESVHSISARMRRVAEAPEFATVGGSLLIEGDTPQRLADLALALYASTDDFTSLHGVTGLEAISRLRPYVDDVERLDRATFQALAAAYLSIGAPALWSSDRLDEMSARKSLDDEIVAHRAGVSDDEHVAKIVFTARRQHEVTGDPLYLAVAARAVSRDVTITGD